MGHSTAEFCTKNSSSENFITFILVEVLPNPIEK